MCTIFILNGDIDAGIRLEGNDVVIVKAYKNLVNVTGNVKRPKYYEMLENGISSTIARVCRWLFR